MKELREFYSYIITILIGLISWNLASYLFPDVEPRKLALMLKSFLGVIGFFSILSIIVYAGLKKKDPPK